MKKNALLFFALLLLALLLTFASCGGTETTPAPGSSQPAGESSGDLSDRTLPEDTTPQGPTIGNPSALFYPSTESDRLPTIAIKTEGEQPIVSRDDYIAAAISVSGSTDDTVFGFTDRSAEVRCRGNYSYTGTEKKSYRLKFTEPINLFGQGNGPAKSWVLLAEHCDQSFLRNHLAFGIASKLSELSYVSSSSFVRLEINGAFAGIYHLAEQHQVNSYRVNIHEDPGEIDTDYFIERDSYADENGNREGLNYFVVEGTKYLVQSDNMTEEKCEFLWDFFWDAVDAIRGGNRTEIEQYIDLDSLIDMYLVQVMSKNIDVGYSSFFMVKKAGGPICFTCPWDFDLAFGNDKRLDNGSPEGLYVGEQRYDVFQQHEWFYLLFNERWFCSMVRARWNHVKSDILSVADEIDRITAHFGDDMASNFDLWPFPRFSVNQEPNAILKLRTYPEHTSYLKEWFMTRYAYLDDLFNSDAIYEQGGYDWGWGW